MIRRLYRDYSVCRFGAPDNPDPGREVFQFAKPAHEGRFYGCNVIGQNGSMAEFLILTAINASAAEFGASTTFRSEFSYQDTLFALHPWRRNPRTAHGVSLRTVHTFDCGEGHIIQRLQRLLGIPVDEVPRPRLTSPCIPVRNRVVVSPSVRLWGHGAQRLITEQTRQLLKAWITSRKDLKFVQLGHPWVDLGIKKVVEDFRKSVIETAKASIFIGIPSGWMHLAAAWKKQSVVIINEVPSLSVFFPQPRTNCHEGLLWLYPQNKHFHETTGTLSCGQLCSEQLNTTVQSMLVSMQGVAFGRD